MQNQVKSATSAIFEGAACLVGEQFETQGHGVKFALCSNTCFYRVYDDQQQNSSAVKDE